MKLLLSYLYAFLTDGALLVGWLLPIYLLARLLYVTIHQDKTLAKKLRPDHELLLLAFFVFLVMLFTQTFVENSGRNELRLIPFDIIRTQFAEMTQDPDAAKAFLFNVVGNIGIFVPVGFLAAAIFRRGFWKTTGIGLLISLCIEIGQLPLDRTTDVDDLILNTTGAALGYAVYWICKRLSCRRKK